MAAIALLKFLFYIVKIVYCSTLVEKIYTKIAYFFIIPLYKYLEYYVNDYLTAKGRDSTAVLQFGRR